MSILIILKQSGKIHNMKVYFIRHGQTQENRALIHQTFENPLGKEGINQSKKVAKKLSKTHFDRFFSSPYKRAEQTAEIINKELNLKIETKELTAEFKNPTQIMGKKYDDPSIQNIKALIKKNIRDPNYHYSDEENATNFVTRIKKLKKYLETLEEKKILIVSHGQVIKQFSYQITNQILNNEVNAYLKCKEIFKTNNTGVTKFEYRKGSWTMLGFNDISHLE